MNRGKRAAHGPEELVEEVQPEMEHPEYHEEVHMDATVEMVQEMAADVGAFAEEMEGVPVAVEEGLEGDMGLPKKKPKRRKSGYQYYVTENRKLVAAEQPDLTFGQTTAKLGAMWKALADEEKLRYEKMAYVDQKDDGVYFDDLPPGPLQSALAPEDQTPKKRGRKRKERKWTKDPTAPKKAVTPYILFGKEVRELVMRDLATQMESVKPTDIMREISIRWHKLTTDQKSQYDERAMEDKKRYEEEKNKWLANRPQEDRTNKKAKLKESQDDNDTNRRALLVRERGAADEAYVRVTVQPPYTMKQLLKKIQAKTKDPRPILEIYHVEGTPQEFHLVRVQDDDDVRNLLVDSQLEIIYADLSAPAPPVEE